MTHHASCSLLRFTLPAEPGAGGHLNNAIAGWRDRKGADMNIKNQKKKRANCIMCKYLRDCFTLINVKLLIIGFLKAMVDNCALFFTAIRAGKFC